MKNKVARVAQKLDDKNPDDLQGVLDGLPHGVAVFDQYLTLRHTNCKLSQLLDVAPSSLKPGMGLKDILYINWNSGAEDNSSDFTSRILSELSKATKSDDLYPFSYEYNPAEGRILEIKGDIMSGAGLILTYTDITSRAKQNYYLESVPPPVNDQMIEFESERLLMEQQASKAVQIAEDLAITREKAENAARHIEAILNAISDVLITLDTKGVILTCNHAVKSMFGFSPDEVIGSNLLDLVNTTPVMSKIYIEKFLAALKEDGQKNEHKGLGYKKNGTTFPVEMNIREVTISGERQFTTVISDVTERHEAETLIREMALHDSLTGLANRNLLQQRLDEALRMALRMNKNVAVMFLDLDMFKPVNDMYGHATGDKLLRIVANRLEGCAREIDTVARLGGDEFAMIITNIDDKKDVTKAADRILEKVRKPITIDGISHQIGTSIGISFFPYDSEDPEELFRMADVALYQAKDDGKCVYRLYDEKMDTLAKTEKQIEIDLDLAIRNNELVLHFQPLLDTIDYSIVGAEALVRWQHPTRGMIPPFSFIPIAENSDLILTLGQWILEAACKQARQWQDMGLPHFRTCVNISARQFQAENFIDTVRNALDISRLDPGRLELEITEGMVIGDTESVAKKLEILAELGISLAIDDFGTGYSSLAYLKRFPVNQLKIDQSFIQDIIEDHDDAAITDAVIRLGHSLGLTVVAEGVETEEQIQILRQKGCDVLQGYYFSKPIPSDKFEQWVTGHNVKRKF